MSESSDYSLAVVAAMVGVLSAARDYPHTIRDLETLEAQARATVVLLYQAHRPYLPADMAAYTAVFIYWYTVAYLSYATVLDEDPHIAHLVAEAEAHIPPFPEEQLLALMEPSARAIVEAVSVVE